MSKQNRLITTNGVSPTGLPKGWADIELADHIYIAGRIGWRGLKAEEYTQSGPVLVSVPNLNHGDRVDFSKVSHISKERYDESPEIQLQIGDTLLVKDGAGIGKLGYVASLPGKATINSSLLVVRPSDGLISPLYLFQYLKGPDFQAIARDRITGSATPHLFQRDVKQFRVLVPPMPEQRRIVAKVEELQQHIDASREHLAKVPKILKAFRQSVIAAACSGRLTEDWRERHPPQERIEEIIENIWRRRERQLSSPKEKIRVRAIYEAPEEGESGELPDGWRYVSLRKLCSSFVFVYRVRIPRK